MDSCRIDKWLWAVRLFKTRAIAADFCSSGKVSRRDTPLKPASSLAIGDVLTIPFPTGPGYRTITVLTLISQRTNASIASSCYSETTTEANREIQKNWHDSRALNPGGRPTKKNRRDLDKIHWFTDP